MILLFFQRHTDLFGASRQRMLHVAPEPVLAEIFERFPTIDYLSADLHDTRAMIRMDITSIPFPDDHFDVIYCSHVLEHVPDDRGAMAELCRVLRPLGFAILQVPITAEHTWSDSALQTAEQRRRAYGQWDHVRRYGPDYRDLLEDAGFIVRVEPFVSSLPGREVTRLGLSRSEDVYLCRKTAPRGSEA